MALPSTRTFLTSLISSLDQAPSTTSITSSTTTPTSNPLKQATPAQKSLLLTLHVLYPNELLSALDLLDRELVTRIIIKDPTTSTSTGTGTDLETQGNNESAQNQAEAEITSTLPSHAKQAVYYVRSAQQNPTFSRFRDAVAPTTHYEVRTLAWSCSCPAFIFSAFPAGGSEVEDEEEVMGEAEREDEEDEQEWKVGGLSLGRDVPMCKHLLACVLAERGGFGGFVKTRGVCVEEMAGWGAGWGN